MRDAAYEQLAQVEEQLWWHASRRQLVRDMLGKVSMSQEGVALDVGCGSGGSLQLLSEFADRVIGVDLSERALDIARHKHPTAELRRADANALQQTFEPDTFDLVTMFSVLYHQWVKNDANALGQVFNVLKPGGVLVLNEPAFSFLSRNHDRATLGVRRYTLRGIRNLVEQAGFAWLQGTYFNVTCFVPAWLLAWWDRRRAVPTIDGPTRETALPPHLLNVAMGMMMAGERGLIRMLGRLPVGVSLMCVARKPLKCVDRQGTDTCSGLNSERLGQVGDRECLV